MGAPQGPRRPAGTPVIHFEGDSYSPREPHEQSIPEGIFLSVPNRKFTSTQFVAYLSGKDMSFNPQGGITLKLGVPREMVQQALALREVFMLPLSVDIQVWEPYSSMEDTQEASYES